MAKGGQNRPNTTTTTNPALNVPNDGFTYGLQDGEYVRIPATSGQFKYIGLFSDQDPTIDNNKGEIALHHDTTTDVYSIYMSSYDINNYPFAYLAETFGSNYEDNDNIFPTKYSEGAEIVVMSQEPSFAFSGLVIGVARPNFFIIKLEQFRGFSYQDPALTSPQVSFNITASPSYTRHTARLNKGHFNNTNSPTFYKSLNIVTEKVTCENDIFLLKELESTFTDYPIVLVKPEAFFVFSQENSRVIFNNEIIVSNEGNNIYLSLSGIVDELGEAIGGNIHYTKISAENPTTVNLASGIDVTYEEAVNITFTGEGTATYVGTDYGYNDVANVSSTQEFIAAYLDNTIGTINIKRTFTLSGVLDLTTAQEIKTIVGTHLSIGDLDIKGGKETSFKNEVRFNNSSIVADAPLLWRFTYCNVDSNDLVTTVNFSSNIEIIYEKLYRGLNIAESLVFTGGSSISRKVWSNTAFNSITSKVTNLEEFNLAMISRDVGIIEIQDRLTLSGVINTEQHPSKIIQGDSLVLANDLVWTINKGSELYIKSDVQIYEGATATINKTQGGLYFSTIYGVGNAEGGNAYHGNNGGTIENIGVFLQYQTLVDGVQINGNSSRLLWNNISFSATHFVHTEFEFIEALKSPYAKTIQVERAFTVYSAISQLITDNKIVKGASITFDCSSSCDLSIDGGQKEIRFYNDIITVNGQHTINSLNECKIFIRTIRNTEKQTLNAVNSNDIFYEKSLSIVDGNSANLFSWDNTTNNASYNVAGTVKISRDSATSTTYISFDGSDTPNVQ